ncbi:hypothetical protein [Actinoplanes regularis]|uniref:hypothetical protein n=1 Tax=Actinoplanes regularis TaxID=52697 RepID=UPI00255472F4|nr:hypothetical protein [Actinoplanes regularis]
MKASTPYRRSWLDFTGRLMSLTMTQDEPPLLSDKWPHLAAELMTALREEEESDLARQVGTLHVLEQCDCDDDFCQSFYTAPKPNGAYGPGHRNVGLSPSRPGYLILDVVNGTIMYIEVLYRPPLT